MDKQGQEQEHEHTANNATRVIAGLLAVGAMVLAACSGAADAQTTTSITQVTIAGESAAEEAGRFANTQAAQMIQTAEVGAMAQAAPLTDATCTLPTGCIVREEGSNAQWWADSWEKGTCRGHTSEDWIVTYKVNNDQWRDADQSQVRFYAAEWSNAEWWKWAGELQVENNSLSSGGGITVCLSGVFFMSSDDVKGTYLWLKP